MLLFIGLIVVATVLYKKSWVFFAAFLLGLFMDLFNLRPLGQTGLLLTVFIFIIWLYERKFETQTMTFVFISTFLGTFIYLMVFGYGNVFLQSLVSAIIGVFLFRVILSKAKDLDSSLRSE